MFITPSFKKSLIVEQFQGNYLKREVDVGYKFKLQIILRSHAGVSNYSSQVLLVSQVVAAFKSLQRNKNFSSEGYYVTSRERLSSMVIPR